MSPAYSPYINKIQDELQNVLSTVPFIRIGQVIPAAASAIFAVDIERDLPNDGFEIVLKTPSAGWSLAINTKRNGEPRIVRDSCLWLQSTLTERTNHYPIVAANYLGEKSRKICREMGVGYVDLSGNCRLVFDNVFIEREGFPNSKIERRSLRNLFSTKSSRIVRVLFDDPERYWTVQDMAKIAQVSIGLVSKVKQRLLEQEYIITNGAGFRIANPAQLIKEWSRFYSFRDHQVFECYAPGGMYELDDRLRKYCTNNGIRYALTLFSASSRFAPFMRGLSLSSAYVQAAPETIIQDLKWKIVPSGANFLLMKPSDAFVFRNSHNLADQYAVVSDVQLYLDLASYRGRGEESAEFILDTRLKRQWAKETEW